jgi:hypothetical protein
MNMKRRLFFLVLVVTVAFVSRGIFSAQNPESIPAYLLIGLGMVSLGTGAVAYMK